MRSIYCVFQKHVNSEVQLTFALFTAVDHLSGLTGSKGHGL